MKGLSESRPLAGWSLALKVSKRTYQLKSAQWFEAPHSDYLLLLFIQFRFWGLWFRLFWSWQSLYASVAINLQQLLTLLVKTCCMNSSWYQICTVVSAGSRPLHVQPQHERFELWTVSGFPSRPAVETSRGAQHQCLQEWVHAGLHWFPLLFTTICLFLLVSFSLFWSYS